MQQRAKWVPLRLAFVTCHLLMDESGCVLIDTGLIGGPGRLVRALREHGRDVKDVRAILLTHGHLDHTGGLAKIAEMTGAKVYAHAEEQAHIDGVYRYRGIARVCGGLEAFGRAVIRYRRRQIDEVITDGQVLPMWGGLRVVHLPGHTRGHCGFYSEREDVLFCGDLCDFGWLHEGISPAIFNSCPGLYAASMEKAARMKAGRIVANHYWGKLTGEQMRERFERIAARSVGEERGG